MWAQTKQYRGFTIVELLIVIVVIAILAAISVVAYNGIQSRAIESSARSDAAMFAKKMGLFNAEYGYYPKDGADMSNFIRAPFSRANYLQDKGNFMFCSSTNGASYMLIVRATNSKNYYYGSADSFQQYTGTIDTPSAMCAQVGFTAANSVWGFEPSATGWSNPGYRPWTGA